MCINLQAAGNPSLMIRYQSTHPFSVGEEKAPSMLFWNLRHAIGATFQNRPLKYIQHPY